MTEQSDIFLFSKENIIKQSETATYTLGFYTVRFYTENGRPVNRKTDELSDYYLYPSGGTLRDSSFNIIFYDSRVATYRGFRPPHRRRGV